MSEATGLGGLRAAADATVLAGVHVTPALKQRLMTRIRTLAQLGSAEDTPHTAAPRAPRRRQRWLAVGGWSVAAAAVLALALMAGNPGGGPQGVGSAARDGAGDDGLRLRAGAEEARVTRSAAKLSLSGADLASPGGSLEQVNLSIAIANSAASGLGASEAQPGRKVIVNGDYSLRVEDAHAVMDRLQALASDAGGYVAEASLVKASGGGWEGRLVLRIPAARFDGVVQDLGQMGQIEGERRWVQDVTDQFMDLEHRLAIQKEHEARLQELAVRAETFDDWNKLAAQINETRAQIENMAGKLKLLSNQVEYAILKVQVIEPAAGEVRALSGADTLPAQLQQAFVNSTRRMINLSRRALVGVAALGPYALALVPPAVLLLVWWRRRRQAQ